MMRTMLNVAGSLTNSIMVDCQLGLMDMDKFNDMNSIEMDNEE